MWSASYGARAARAAAGRSSRRGGRSRARPRAGRADCARSNRSVDHETVYCASFAPSRPRWCVRRARHAAAGSGRVAHLDRRAVQADELRVHRRVERAPVVPALGLRQARADCRRRRCRSAGGGSPFAHQSRIGRVTPRPIAFIAASFASIAARVPLQPEVVVDARVVRLRRRLDQRRRDVAVLVEHVRRQPLLHDRDRRLRLGLRLRQEVAVQVEVVAVRALVRDAAVGVLVDVPQRGRRGRGSRRPRGRCRTASSPARSTSRTSRRLPRTRSRGSPTG